MDSSVFPTLRLHLCWTLCQFIVHDLFPFWLRKVSAVEFQFPQLLELGAEKEGWAVVPTADDRLYRKSACRCRNQIRTGRGKMLFEEAPEPVRPA